MLALMFHLSIFYSFYNKCLIKHTKSLDGEVELANLYLSRPEINFIYYMYILKVYLAMIEMDESDK